MNEVVQQLRTLILRDDAELTDGQLLETYARGRQESALSALVCRHGAMVWGVCRRLLANPHDAEDAFQATFLVLVRKATSIVPREMVGNWLYGVAYQTALKARSTAAKRQAREKQVPVMPDQAEVEANPWDNLQAILDQELSGLPDKYRVAILLCDLEGKTRTQAARQLKCPEGTIAARVARGRVMLARRLARRGLVLSAGALATVLAQNVATASVPGAVAASAVKAATLFASGETGIISARVVALAEGVLTTMLLKKLKAASALLFVIACLTAATAGFLYAATAETSEAQPAPAQKKDPASADAELLQGSWRAVKVEVNGVEIPFFVVGSQAVFAGNKLTTNFIEGSDFTFQLKSQVNPKGIDLQKTKEPRESLVGIYRLKDGVLTLCIRKGGEERPTEFQNYWGAGTHTALFVLERPPAKAKADAPKKELPKDGAAKSDRDLLQGTWHAASILLGGQASTEEEVKAGKYRITFQGDRFRSSDKTGLRGEGTYKLDPDKHPKCIDMVIEKGPDEGKTYRMIYKIEKDALTIVEPLETLPGERPTAFISEKEGPNRGLAVFKRETPMDPRTALQAAEAELKNAEVQSQQAQRRLEQARADLESARQTLKEAEKSFRAVRKATPYNQLPTDARLRMAPALRPRIRNAA